MARFFVAGLAVVVVASAVQAQPVAGQPKFGNNQGLRPQNGNRDDSSQNYTPNATHLYSGGVDAPAPGRTTVTGSPRFDGTKVVHTPVVTPNFRPVSIPTPPPVPSGAISTAGRGLGRGAAIAAGAAAAAGAAGAPARGRRQKDRARLR